MTKFRISERPFLTVQGEGIYAGVPTVFIRLFGCNFRCKKFGMDPAADVGSHNPEVAEIIKNLSNYKTFKDLPLVSTGCDTYASIYPEFKHFIQEMSIEEIVNDFKTVAGNLKYGRDLHIVVTGGEPLLPGWQKGYAELFDELHKQLGVTHITFETNATRPLSDEFKTYLNQSKNVLVTFSMSPKLPCSGEAWENAIKPDVVKSYVDTLNTEAYFKFVVSSKKDIVDVHLALEEYKLAGIDIPVYLMPVGGVNAVYELNERAVADYCVQHGFRFSPRLQVSLWKNAWGT